MKGPKILATTLLLLAIAFFLVFIYLFIKESGDLDLMIDGFKMFFYKNTSIVP